jgi:hypothetical protein
LAVMKIEELYDRYVRPLPPAERIKLIAMTAQDLSQSDLPTEIPKRSIMELHGLGKEMWQGVDVQKHVEELRQEWADRP